MKTINVTEDEMKSLMTTTTLSPLHIRDRTFPPDVIAVDYSIDTEYHCPIPFDKYWWASDDPLLSNYVPPDQRV